MLYSVLKKVNFKERLSIVDSNNNTHVFGKGKSNLRIRLTNKSIEKKLFRNPSLHFGEGYMNKEILIEEGSIEQLIDLITSCYDDFIQHNSVYKIYENFSGYFKIFQQLNELVKSKQNVAHHYDLNEDLYKLFLDKDMQYSCAYFHNENISLDQAQIDKKNHIINKLQISENMKVLDIGCGWGGMAIEIAKQTGATVKGITLSENQFATASKRAQEEGLSEKLTFKLQDYRNENEIYDRIVSVGMFEHVGRKNHHEYYNKCYELLKDNGIMLIHTIITDARKWIPNGFINKYIFPEGEIPHIENLTRSFIDKWHLEDVQNFGISYSKTLRKWRKNIGDWEGLDSYDERFRRMWHLYLLGCLKLYSIPFLNSSIHF